MNTELLSIHCVKTCSVLACFHFLRNAKDSSSERCLLSDQKHQISANNSAVPFFLIFLFFRLTVDPRPKYPKELS